MGAEHKTHTKQVAQYKVELDDDAKTITVEGNGKTRTKSFEIRPLAHVEFDSLKTEEAVAQWVSATE